MVHYCICGWSCNWVESGKRLAYLEFGRQYLEKNVVDIENNTTVLRRRLLPGENVDDDISSGEDIDVDSGSKENNETKNNTDDGGQSLQEDEEDEDNDDNYSNN